MLRAYEAVVTIKEICDSITNCAKCPYYQDGGGTLCFFTTTKEMPSNWSVSKPIIKIFNQGEY